MRMGRRVVTVLSLSLPLAAWAAVPVVSDNGGAYPSSGYGTSGASAGVGASGPTSAQGQLFMQLQQMQDQISRQQGIIEELQNDVSRLKQEGLERYQDLDRRISSGAAPATAAENSASAGAASGASANASNGAGNNAGASNAGSEAADPAKEKLFYEAAFDQIKQKDFDKAAQAFTAFLRKYPNSQYAGNAQYWLGEVNLAKGDLPAASQAFAKVSQNYPKHSKVPDSLYKLADVERRQGHTDKVKGILQQVINQYPGTSAAQLAQRDLQRL